MTGKKLNEMIRKRDRMFAALQRHGQFLEDYVEGDLNEVKPRLEKLNAKWDEFEVLQDHIESLDESGAHEDENATARGDFEKLYFATKAGLQNKTDTSRLSSRELSEVDLSTTRAAGGVSSGVRLPQIALPEFDGDFNNWLCFRDTYVALIHDSPELSAIQKFHYLKASLKEEAAKLIESITLTADNYLIAWETVRKRFSNEYLLKKKHLQAILDYPKVKRESAAAIYGIVDEFEQRTKILKQLGEETDHWGALLVHLLCSKLDDASLKAWEDYAASLENPNYEQLVEFLQKRSRVLEAVLVDLQNSHSGPSATSQSNRFVSQRRVVSTAAEQISSKCHCCGEFHLLVRCPKFQQMKLEERLDMVNRHRICSNCFRSDHWVRDCRSGFVCRTCGRRHHSLIHPGFPLKTTSEQAASVPVCYGEEIAGTTDLDVFHDDTRDPEETLDGAVVNSSSVNLAMKRSQVLLSTVIIGVRDHGGRLVLARALLDSGSQINIISERLCQILKLKRRVVNIPISGVGQAVTNAKNSVAATIQSRVSEYSRLLHFLVLPAVTRDLPVTNIHTNNWNIPSHVQLADPTFNVSNRIDLLIGSETFYEFLFECDMKKIELGPSMPILVNSVFGWVVAGRTDGGDEGSVLCHVAADEQIPVILERFWQVEDLSDRLAWSQEETDCEKHFLMTHERTPEGRYMVRLPKHINFQNMLGDTAKMAYDRFQKLEKRLENDADLRSQYREFMEEYLKLGQMKKVAECESWSDVGRTINEGCFLPHHPVIKESSTTTKVRVVFDGSARTSTGFSLNNALLKGPVTQDELLALLIRFRKHQIGLVADVEKMYRQVALHPEDTKYQRIFWRFNPDEPIGIYELQTVTYGLTPSSFLATRCLQQLSDDEKKSFPLAGQAVKKDFYVDDYLGGADNLPNAVELRKELSIMMMEGGFRLRKWCSNCPEALVGLEPADLGTQLTLDFKLEAGQHIKTLGVTWEPSTDCLRFHYSAESCQYKWTKRKVLSAIARLFDPLGLAAPVIAKAKIFMQELALLNVDWDDSLPSNFEGRWNQFHKKLVLLAEVQVDRLAFITEAVDVQLHVFADASEKGYGACVYVRSENSNKEVQVELLAAKSRVAPLKRLTLPRLELCAAREAAKLYAKISKALGMKNTSVYLWSDSTIVLHWLKSPPNTWNTFVANRVSEIQSLTFGHPWNHISGKENPADLVSRGLDADQFLASALWKRGPEWLKRAKPEWPVQYAEEEIPLNDLESREVVVTTSVSLETNPLFNRFSMLSSLLRMAGYCHRFITNCRSKDNRITEEFITVEELNSAKILLTRMVQHECFSAEIKDLRSNKFVSRKSPLKLLSPILDPDGIIRVGGRLGLSNEDYSVKHPAVIPKSHPYTKLIIEYFHRQSKHGGNRLTLALVRQEFWPIHGKRAVSSILRNCYRCFRVKPQLVQQPVGQLPPSRVRPSRPFTFTGVDYCGPVYLKPIHRKAAPGKAYISVFVCFSTKAVHLELATDLSTACFISALRRFVGHHGLPAEMHSDNGKNFAGANNHLQELYTILNNKNSKNQIASECASQGIKWIFIPPKAPNFGGLWESAVRSAKTSLKRQLGTSLLSTEDMQTLLVQIAASMNSRPLIPLTDDPADFDVITPAHFLIGTSMKALPDPDLRSIKTSRLDHYQQMQQLFQLYWQRWRKEYLTELHTSLRNRQANIIRPGCIVVLRDEYLPPLQWPLARVIKVYPGPDGVVRVVILRTATGQEYKRPVSKICLLPEDSTIGLEAAPELVPTQPTTRDST